MAESTEHPSEQDQDPKKRIQVVNLKGTPLDEYMFVDWLRGGRCRIVGQYNITQEPHLNPDETTSQKWVFDERSLVWTPPPFYMLDGVAIQLDSNSRPDVETFVSANSFEIMGYIKNIAVSW